MSNIEKLEKIFSESLRIDLSLVNNELQYNSIREWDSIAHMALITALEDNFDVMLDTSDIVDMSSVAKAKEIMARHGVEL